MLANNETGVIQPVAEAAEIVHMHDGLLHCDAVQAAGRLAIDMASLGVDMMTLSAHKLGGPQGSGALLIDERVSLQAQARGGGQERGYRAGTENVAGIVGFGAAAELAGEHLGDWQRVSQLRDRLEARISDVFGDQVLVFGQDVTRIPNTCCIARAGIASETQIIALDLAGIAVSAGSACSSGKVQSSHVLAAAGNAETIARTAIRVSLGLTTTDADVDRFFEAYKALKARGVADAA
jgi:cysteine desulfurase